MNAVPISPNFQSSEQTQIDQFTGLCLVSSKSLLQRTPGTASSLILTFVDNASMATFDEFLRKALCRITNCDLTDTQWLQASLTIGEGSMGVR